MTWKNTFRVGSYKCELSYTLDGELSTSWSPKLPKQGLSEQEALQYRAGRDALLSEIAAATGGNVVVIET